MTVKSVITKNYGYVYEMENGEFYQQATLYAYDEAIGIFQNRTMAQRIGLEEAWRLFKDFNGDWRLAVADGIQWVAMRDADGMYGFVIRNGRRHEMYYQLELISMIEIQQAALRLLEILGEEA
jgi:hypothetical protein